MKQNKELGTGLLEALGKVSLDGGAALTGTLSLCNLPRGLSSPSEHKGCTVWKQLESNLYKSLL